MTILLLLASLLVQDPQAPNGPVTTLPQVEVAGEAPVATPQAGDDNREDQRMVCRSELTMGSNRRKRVCMTVAERRAMAEESREYRDSIDRNQRHEEVLTHEQTLGGPTN